MRIIPSLTVTDLDDFRRYREQEEMTLAELLRRLRREEGPSAAMLAGSALHSLLEKPPTEVLTSAEIDGHRFLFTLDAELPLLSMRELSGRKEYRVDGGTVELRGRVDAIDGVAAEDHKLSRTFDADRYVGKYQWRAYLSIFGAQKFTYNVFVGDFLGTDEETGLQEWEIRDFHRLTLYRYPEMESDIVRELGRYLDFANEHVLAPRRAA